MSTSIWLCGIAHGDAASLSQGPDGERLKFSTLDVFLQSSRIPDQIIREVKSLNPKTWLVLVSFESSGIISLCHVVFTSWLLGDQFLALLLWRAKVNKAVKKQNAKRKARGHEFSHSAFLHHWLNCLVLPRIFLGDFSNQEGFIAVKISMGWKHGVRVSAWKNEGKSIQTGGQRGMGVFAFVKA